MGGSKQDSLISLAKLL